MCISFGFLASKEEIEQRFHVKVPENVPRGDFFPHRSIPIITRNKPKELQVASWSFLNDKEYSTHNARKESLTESKLYSKAFRNNQTCIILANHFYEYNATKQKYKFTTGKLFAMAGLYNEEDELRVTIITTTPNSVVSEVHSRMPVILEDEKTWLESESPVQLLMSLKPYTKQMNRELIHKSLPKDEHQRTLNF